MKWYGYEVLNALVTDLQPNQKVVDAMNQINAERRLRLAAEEKAEGQKVLVIKAAEVRSCLASSCALRWLSRLCPWPLRSGWPLKTVAVQCACCA